MNWSKILSKGFANYFLESRWLIFLTPNGITIQTKAPQSYTKIILYLSLGAIEI
jgi:hypothetical protein